MTRQCELVAVNRTTVYAPHRVAEPDAQELALRSLIDTEYTRHPFYGSRKMTVYLREPWAGDQPPAGAAVNA